MTKVTDIQNGWFRTNAKINAEVVQEMAKLLPAVFSAYVKDDTYGELNPIIADKVNFICHHIADLMDRIDYVFAKTDGTYGELAPEVASQLTAVYNTIRNFNKENT